jgi:hypothetical protein
MFRVKKNVQTVGIRGEEGNPLSWRSRFDNERSGKGKFYKAFISRTGRLCNELKFELTAI